MVLDSRIGKVKTTIETKFKEIMEEKFAYRLLDFLEQEKMKNEKH